MLQDHVDLVLPALKFEGLGVLDFGVECDQTLEVDVHEFLVQNVHEAPEELEQQVHLVEALVEQTERDASVRGEPGQWHVQMDEGVDEQVVEVGLLQRLVLLDFVFVVIQQLSELT